MNYIEGGDFSALAAGKKKDNERLSKREDTGSSPEQADKEASLPEYRRYNVEPDPKRAKLRAEKVEKYMTEPLDNSELLQLQKHALLKGPKES